MRTNCNSSRLCSPDLTFLSFPYCIIWLCVYRYSGAEFDEVFVSELESAIKQCIAKLNSNLKAATPSAVNRLIQQSQLFKVECSNAEIEQIIETLICDGIVQQIDHKEPLPSLHDRGIKKAEKAYRIISGAQINSVLNTIPCCICPVAAQCGEGNPVNPQSCQYFRAWMEF
jgi:hypothetical protein